MIRLYCYEYCALLCITIIINPTITFLLREQELLFATLKDVILPAEIPAL